MPYTGFFIYATIFKIAIIATGFTCIILGYFLFARLHVGDQSSGTSAGAKYQGFSFTIKNAAPGTMFALFGAAIISVALVTTTPEMLLKSADLKNGTVTEAHMRSSDVSKMGEIFTEYFGDKSITADDAMRQLRDIYSAGQK